MKLLTDFDGHPKILRAGMNGAGLYARALAYCGKYETDGVIPEVWVDHAVAHEGLTDLPARLVELGLWRRCENGYEIRDFLDVNRSREQMEELRRNRSVAGKRGGEAKGKAKAKQKRSKSHSLSSSNSPSSSNSSSEFEEWLEHYRATTEKSSVRGSKPARESFAARRREGRTLEDLKLATVGCHGDEFCREHGHDVPETILRASKVERYIQLAKRPSKPRSRVDELVERGRKAAIA